MYLVEWLNHTISVLKIMYFTTLHCIWLLYHSYVNISITSDTCHIQYQLLLHVNKPVESTFGNLPAPVGVHQS